VTPDLVGRFEACTLPPEEFPHEAHVYVAWSYLRELPLGIAAERFIRNLKRYADSLGKTTLYHETITWAYVLLVNERMDEGDWRSFCAANEDLLTFRPSVLDRYYRPETLSSDRARTTFLMPDRMYEGLR
jgi:hypothetical protein